MATYSGPQDSRLVLAEGDVAQLQALNLLTQQGEQALFKRAVELLKMELVPVTNTAARSARKQRAQT